MRTIWNKLTLAILAPSILALSGCITVPFPFPPSEYNEVTVQEGGKDKILLLDIDGVITGGTQDGMSLFGGGDDTVNKMSDRLALAREDDSIKAVILRIDSPGGGVTPSDVVYELLRDYKAETELPIYVSMLDTAASGGYYIAMAADKIYAHPTTITGSIGVIAMFPQLKNLGDKVGISMETIKSGDNKDIGSPFHKMSDAEREILQGVIDDMYERFLGVVQAGRPDLDPVRARELADGRIYTAQQAADAGLIDGVLYLEDLIDLVREEHDLEKARVVMYRKTAKESYDSVYARTPGVPAQLSSAGASTSVNLLNVNVGDSLAPRGPVFQYLWVP